jgi:hypothetical protein
VAAVESNGYCFQVEMLYRSWQDGFAVTEVPITFHRARDPGFEDERANCCRGTAAGNRMGGCRQTPTSGIPASRQRGQVLPAGPLRAVAQRILRPRSSSTGRRAGCEMITAATRQWQAWPPESLIEPLTATNCQV